MNITYKHISKKDYKAIKQLVKKAWFGDDYLEEEFPDKKPNTNVYATAYLYYHLSTSSYHLGAYNDKGELIGFLFGRSEKERIKRKLINKFKLFLVGVRMLFTKVGRRGLKVHWVEKKADDKMLLEYKKEKNELCLFIVDEEYRERGIGSELEKHFCDHLRKLGKKEVYLFTDTYSNYEYYEKRGYKREQTSEVSFNNEKAEYYIYLKEL